MLERSTDRIKDFLAGYDGPNVNIMEICGSHTEAVARFGIPSLLSDRIKMISGPGCPVCVTTSAYIDKLLELAKEGYVIVTFGDLIRVPGSKKSLSDAKGEGARVEMVYSPLDVIGLAEADPDLRFVFAAVGFETTTPVYALLMEELIEKDIKNVRLLTSLKTMPEVVDEMLINGAPIDGFLAPGHVSVVTGYEVFEPIAEKYKMPFAVSGFEGDQILLSIYEVVKNIHKGKVINCYPMVVSAKGNVTAKEKVGLFFEKCDASWRGLGTVKSSGMRLKSEYKAYDAGSDGLDTDEKKNPACSCDKVLTGRIRPYECPLYAKVCSPINPQGACMVSTEGSCYSYFVNKRND